MKATIHVPCIESSSSSVHQQDHDDNDDDDDDDDDVDDEDDPLNENYIALLHYRSPHHILRLSTTPSPSPAEIQRAHAACRDDTLNALRLIEAKQQQQQQQGWGRTNHAFFMSQLNYLELKLRALDQAVRLLLPHGVATTAEEENDRCHQKEGRGGERKAPLAEEQDKKPITIAATKKIANRTLDRDDDELRTIHVYLRPHTITVRSASWSSESRHSMDMSSVSWDISRHALESYDDDDDDDGLLQVLGPMNTDAKHGTKKKNAVVAAYSRGEIHNRPKDSPRSIVDFPLEDGCCAMGDSGKIGNSSKNDSNNSSNNDSNRQWHRRKPPKPTSHTHTAAAAAAAATPNNTQRTIEAARKGVLRALSEDDSECLPLEEEDDDSPIKTAHHKNTSLSESLWAKRTNEESHANNNDSPMKSVKSETNRSSSSRKSASSQPQRSHSKRWNVVTPSRGSLRSHGDDDDDDDDEDDDDEYRMLKTLVPTDAHSHPPQKHDKNADSNDTLLQSGMALAADICAAFLGVCWEGTASSSSSAKVGFVGKGEHHPSNEYSFSYFVNKEEEEEEDESTVFNSVGSFPLSLSEVSTPESYLEGRYREKKMLV